ncbi:hypothetical protein LTR64_003230 [Lithohypha guttulata]|uniref:uncharacterized protein n=1 Tax=Lithohypha guttulata TaxID=1690604 RepID=UPI002DDE4A3C|nr:hypothetical protein LTR51_000548 [Lithohypha guttulata]
MESLARLQGLHQDLVALTQKSKDVDRLLQDLKDSVTDFRNLLNKPVSTEAETKGYNEGKIEVNGQEYSINEEFRHLSNAVGATLSISEEYAGRLIIETQQQGTSDEESLIADVVQLYHDRRDFLLQDFRLLLAYSLDPDFATQPRTELEELVREVLDTRNGVVANGSNFARKCMQTMLDIEAWQVKLNDAILSKAVLSKARGEAFYKTLEFQRSSLFKQHEALGAILALLFRGNYTASEDLRKLHEQSQTWKRLDFSWIHYLPAFSAAFQQYGSSNYGNPQDAQALNRFLVSATPDVQNGPYRPLAATLEMWWTAEFSSHYSESAARDPGAVKRDEIMKKSLDDGSLEFMLSICTNLKNDPWEQVARLELVDMLLDGSNITFESVEPSSEFFVAMMMEAYEVFADAWITNMPDSIRKLKSEEDDLRLRQVTTTPDGILQRPPREQGARLHLEAFLVVIAFAYEGRPEAAEQFWQDPDGNLHGFLQWTSRRQTVPRVSAFCEMLCAISRSAENADAAHKFLLDDTVLVPNTRGKKFPSMSYQQIFAELDFYSRKVHEKGQVAHTVKVRSNIEPELNEAESPIMLCCYLRLLGHLFQQTSLAREYVLNLNDIDLLKGLLALSAGSIPSYMRATIFSFFEFLVTDKSSAVSDRVWWTIDDWASTNQDRAGKTPGDKQPNPTTIALQNTLGAISTSYDQYDAFVKLLRALIAPLPTHSGQPLPFPPDLGNTYRVPGVVPYVDLVCGELTPANMRRWLEDANTQGVLRVTNAIEFSLLCLQGFNENYVTSLDKTARGSGNQETYEALYVQRHPFARVMQWLFTSNFTQCLTEIVHGLVETILDASLTDPKVRCLEAAVDLLNYISQLQPTFFDIVKPRIRLQDGYKTIPSSGIIAIEDLVISRPELLLDLCQYAASEHVQLSLRVLEFLQRLSESARLQNHLFVESKRDRRGRQMLELIGPEGELKLKNISTRFAEHFIVDPRELEEGGDSPGYLLKDGIVSFFNSCLATQSEAPNIAHLLLGFKRLGSRLVSDIEFDEGNSTFDALAKLSVDLPVQWEETLLSWLIHLKAESICVLKHLWSFPVSAELTMVQLRRQNYLVKQLSGQVVADQDTIWEGSMITDNDFYFLTSAEALTDFMSYRTHLYDYVTREIQQVAKANIRALQEKYLSTLQGKSMDDSGIPINHPSVFDLFDFAELCTDAPQVLAYGHLDFFHDLDFEAYQSGPLYDVDKVQTVVNRRCAFVLDEYTAANRQIDSTALNEEAAYVVGLLTARNRFVLAQAERLSCLKSYVDMIISVVGCCQMEPTTKIQFALRMLQLVLPKLDTYLADGTQEAVELTRLADTLLLVLAEIQPQVKQIQTRVDVTIAEKLFQLFRICAEGVAFSASNPDLRAVLYSICSEYLTRILSSASSNTDSSQRARTNAMDTIRSVGNQLITIISDDADDGLDACRLNALNFLSQLVSLARSQKVNIMIESFVKMNILEVLLDPIKSVAADFQSANPSNRIYLTSVFESRILLLLQVSRTHLGASALLDANLLQTLRDSGLFAADPDLGFDLSSIGPASLVRSTTQNGASASIGCLRLLLSTFLNFGQENEKIIYLVRSFLADHRGNMVGIFKRAAGLSLASQQAAQTSLFASIPAGSVLAKEDRDMRRLVDECMKAYTGLAIGSGFLDFEEDSGLAGNGMVRDGGLGRSNYAGGGFT